jgi:hypothetical protein
MYNLMFVLNSNEIIENSYKNQSLEIWSPKAAKIFHIRHHFQKFKFFHFWNSPKTIYIPPLLSEFSPDGRKPDEGAPEKCIA